jgi:hypothetical protein
MSGTKIEGGYQGGPTPEGSPPIPLFQSQTSDLPPEIKEAGEALLARIKELASQCPPMYIENLVGAYGQLVYIARGK